MNLNDCLQLRLLRRNWESCQSVCCRAEKNLYFARRDQPIMEEMLRPQSAGSGFDTRPRGNVLATTRPGNPRSHHSERVLIDHHHWRSQEDLRRFNNGSFPHILPADVA
ncbi:hypothetical protein AAFF_G00361760 [Aldrovandia affinis]|uniref:Uncharacterized protein n=1 Tax=Aldrovandia affinis TaxID=143900 RepID=A0AAD7SIQ2_9TELE|nr:hypothetical protein AAFF_G00361760 [Aldrovandia affinis]